jgi:hypothetical protein
MLNVLGSVILNGRDYKCGKSFNSFPQFSEQMDRTVSSSDYSEINNSYEFERHSENNTICRAPVLTVLFDGYFHKQTFRFGPACYALKHRNLGYRNDQCFLQINEKH